MKSLFVLLVLLTGCASQVSGSWTIGVHRIHDDSLHVTCWMVYHEGISCIPDQQLLRPQISQ